MIREEPTFRAPEIGAAGRCTATEGAAAGPSELGRASFASAHSVLWPVQQTSHAPRCRESESKAKTEVRRQRA
eukprot:6133963-Prymnesium_polylepis.1